MQESKEIARILGLQQRLNVSKTLFKELFFLSLNYYK